MKTEMTAAGEIRILSIADNIVKVSQTKKECFSEGCFVGSLAEGKSTVDAQVDNKGNVSFSLKGKRITAKGELWEKQLNKFIVQDGVPEIEIIKTVDGQRTFIKNLVEVSDKTVYGARLHFAFAEDEHIYGLGSHEEGVLDYRGRTQFLYQHNMKIPVPFLLSSKGYGILIDCGCNMVFNDDEHGSYLYLNAVDQLDYYVIFGDSVDEIISGFRTLTGKTAMPPLWAFGYIQSKEHYRTQQELIDVVAEFRKRKIPIDCIVQDWNTWDDGMWGNKQLDKARYPDFKSAVDELHALNTAVIVSVWPNMQQGCNNHNEFAISGGLLNDYSTYNAFDPQARDTYFRQLQEELLPSGIDGLWCDSTEPFTAPDWGGEVLREPWQRYDLVAGEHDKYLDPTKANLFAVEHAKGIFEHLMQTSSKRVFNLTRGGYASLQKYGGVVWSGDISATWSTLKKNIAEGLNMAYSGMTYWHTDTGAFFAGGVNCWRKWKGDPQAAPVWFWHGDYDAGVNDEQYCELYVRWLQYSVFSPICRSHGTDTPREPWQFQGAYYDAVVKAIKLRYKLLPYLYSLGAQVYFNDSTIMRGLLFDFAHDKKAAQLSDEFMLGEALLAKPVTDAGVCSVDVYLPACEGWYDFETNKFYAGGQTVKVDVPLDKMPVFAKAGSIVPVANGDPQYAAQCFEQVSIRIYAGKDAHFELYQDNGTDYSYEIGNFGTIVLDYEETKGVLTVHSSGKDKNLFDDSEFAIELISKAGAMLRTLHFSGESVQVSLR